VFENREKGNGRPELVEEVNERFRSDPAKPTRNIVSKPIQIHVSKAFDSIFRVPGERLRSETEGNDSQ